MSESTRPDRAVSDTAESVPTPSPKRRERSTATTGHRPSKDAPGSSQRVMVLALAVAVLAAALGGLWWWLSSSDKSSYSDEEVRDAKAKVCMQSKAVREGVVINTHLVNPVEDDPRGGFAVAANARLALLGGGSYLHDLLEQQPATPKDLADAVSAMSGTLGQLGVSYLAGQPDEAQAPLRGQLDEQLKKVDELCH